MSYPARTVDDTYHACHPELPLEPGDPRYVPLTPVRGGFDLSIVVAQCIRRTRPPAFHRQLVTGHRGSGKSTELKHLQARLREAGYFAVYLDVEAVLDLGDITYLDVLVAIARALNDAIRAEKIRLSRRLLEDLDRWFAETVLTEEQRRDVTGSLNELSAQLLHHRLVLEYVNDERWADLHPAVRRSPRLRRIARG